MMAFRPLHKRLCSLCSACGCAVIGWFGFEEVPEKRDYKPSFGRISIVPLDCACVLRDLISCFCRAGIVFRLRHHQITQFPQSVLLGGLAAPETASSQVCTLPFIEARTHRVGAYFRSSVGTCKCA